VIYGAAGYQFNTMDRTDRPSVAKTIYEIARTTVDDIHAGKWASR